MRERVLGALVGGCLLVVGACSGDRKSQTPAEPGGEPPTAEGSSPTGVASTTVTAEPAPTSTATTTTATSTTVPAATTSPSTTSTSTTSTTAAPTTTSSTTTTTTAAPLPVHNPKCVIEIRPGDSLSLIAAGVPKKSVTVANLQTENGIGNPDAIQAGDYLDICVKNKINDITGEKRVPRPRPAPGTNGTGVAAQQQKLNELFDGYGIAPLAVDGDSGRYTEQRLCAARAALHMPISRADMEPGSDEEKAMMAADSLMIPDGAPVGSSRWALIDQTCQIMFVGEGSNRLVFVFPTSTGEPGHETRDQNGSRVFRYDPARDNDGWHNSSVYPVPADNPLNGNMYLPLYFDDGQAIHGANNVPPEPQSKGCARLQVHHQDALVDWLGLRDAAEPVWDTGRIEFTVSVHGRF